MTQLEIPAHGPVRLSRRSAFALGPATRAAISGGLWGDRRRVNREVSIPDGWDRLHEAGNFANLELAAGRAGADYANELPFLDSDVYKWLEAVGWVLADPDLEPALAARLRDQLAQTVNLLRAAQRDDGYLDSYFQVHSPGERFVQLPWGHELYCAGHLIQAALAVHRSTGDDELLAIARRVADLVVSSFGTEPGRIDGVCGHPEIETALVELHRETGEQAYLDRARYFIDRRGHGLLGAGRFGAQYWQDHRPIREATAVTGHAVRQLYLLAGVADLQVEDDDASLRAAAERLWTEMVATQTYLTGGIGAHHTDEAFGDPYELPNERSYCETCAAIASIMFSWRMLMITGESKYADLLERTLYNGFLAGLSLDGQRYIYANPLQVRDDHVDAGTDADYQRRRWFRCACCPPNVMRLLASLEHYILLADDHRAVVHQYVSGRYSGADLALEVETGYPWTGEVTVRVSAAPPDQRELVLRVPEWAGAPILTVNGEAVESGPADGWWTVGRRWIVGDIVELRLPLKPRFTRADRRVDSARASVALECGPLVYCFEAADHPGLRLDDVSVDTAATPATVVADSALGTVAAIEVAGRVHPQRPASWWPYRTVEADDDREATLTQSRLERMAPEILLTAIPYYTWGNRGPGAMRIWTPSTR